TSEIEPQHPEKVLLVLQEFAEKREEEHLRMIAALIEASRFCDVSENRPELARMLAQPAYFDVNRKLLENALVGPFRFGCSQRVVNEFVLYDASKVGAPSRAKGKWVFDLVRTLGGPQTSPAVRSEIVPRVFREDIFNKAARLVGNAAIDLKLPAGAPPFFRQTEQLALPAGNQDDLSDTTARPISPLKTDRDASTGTDAPFNPDPQESATLCV
ncbi:MAG TPA: ABC transporter substrate-binding protein, partial [Candidatus Paceibacterota bacterium]|nr:ABC transporter substrate-binding protein [Candidatus Paceibacterota bacterium]